jgi:hypothetical protein
VLKNVVSEPVPVLLIVAFYSIGSEVYFAVKRFVLPEPVPVSVVVYGLLNIKPFPARRKKCFYSGLLTSS